MLIEVKRLPMQYEKTDCAVAMQYNFIRHGSLTDVRTSGAHLNFHNDIQFYKIIKLVKGFISELIVAIEGGKDIHDKDADIHPILQKIFTPVPILYSYIQGINWCRVHLGNEQIISNRQVFINSLENAIIDYYNYPLMEVINTIKINN